jgi:hypothetical protein
MPIWDLLKQRGQGAEAMRQSATLTTAYLLEQNRKFEAFMRARIAELEGRVAGQQARVTARAEEDGDVVEEPPAEAPAEDIPRVDVEQPVAFFDQENAWDGPEEVEPGASNPQESLPEVGAPPPVVEGPSNWEAALLGEPEEAPPNEKPSPDAEVVGEPEAREDGEEQPAGPAKGDGPDLGAEAAGEDGANRPAGAPEVGEGKIEEVEPGGLGPSWLETDERAAKLVTRDVPLPHVQTDEPSAPSQTPPLPEEDGEVEDEPDPGQWDTRMPAGPMGDYA